MSEEGRATTLASAMAFERTLLVMDLEGQEEADAGEILAQGGRYDLSLVTDEADEFMTIKLKEK
jgi:hypothetical protein